MRPARRFWRVCPLGKDLFGKDLPTAASRAFLFLRFRIVPYNPEVPIMKIACSCCRYFAPKSASRSRNECRRHTPAPRLPHDQSPLGIWPAVLPDHWCGEFKRRVTIHSSMHAIPMTRIAG
jgi:hypothetical protein